MIDVRFARDLIADKNGGEESRGGVSDVFFRVADTSRFVKLDIGLVLLSLRLMLKKLYRRYEKIKSTFLS